MRAMPSSNILLVIFILTAQILIGLSLEAHFETNDRHNDSGINSSSDQPSSNSNCTRNAYLYGTLAVSLLSLSSLLGALLVPDGDTTKRSAVQYIVNGLIAMGVGILIGDAIIHLVPQALGLHGDTHDGELHSTSTYLGKSVAMVTAIYLLFLFESVSLVALPNDESHGHSHQMTRGPPVKSKIKTISQQTLSDGIQDVDPSISDECLRVSLHSTPVVCFGLRNLALIITLGSAIHNFADGLIIGTSFATGTSEGISSSLAILCHELPHELGDFAVLMSTGLSRRKAIVVNLVASISSFIGLYIGLAIGSDESTIQWTMSVTVGMFLFVALGDMMPELKSLTRSHSKPWAILGVQNVAMIIGIGFTVVVAIYEKEISPTI